MPAHGRHHLVEIEMVRGFAILAVIALHSDTPAYVQADPTMAAGVFALLLRNVAIIGVPIFLMLSGAGLHFGYSGGVASGSALRRYYARRLNRLVLPYVTWSILSLAMTAPGRLTATGIGSAVLTGSASFQYYFVPLILQWYTIFPLLQCRGRHNIRFRGVLTTILGGIVMLAWWRYRPELFAAPFWLPAWLAYPLLGSTAAPALVFLRDRARRWPLLIHLSALGWGLCLIPLLRQSMVEHTVFAPTMYQLWTVAASIAAAVLLFVLSTRMAVHGGFAFRCTRNLGRHSYGIFLVHAIPLGWLATKTASWPAPLACLAVLAGTLVGSWVTVAMLSRIPVARRCLT